MLTLPAKASYMPLVESLIPAHLAWQYAGEPAATHAAVLLKIWADKLVEEYASGHNKSRRAETATRLRRCVLVVRSDEGETVRKFCAGNICRAFVKLRTGKRGVHFVRDGCDIKDVL